MKYTFVSALFAATNFFVAQAQINNSSDSFYLQFSNSTLSDLKGKLNVSDRIFAGSGPLPLEIQPDGSLVADLTNIDNQPTTFSITSEKGLVSNDNSTLDSAAYQSNATSLTGFDVANGVLNFNGLEKWTINVNGTLATINLPATESSGVPVSLNAVTIGEPALPQHIPQQKNIVRSAVYDVGGWNGSLYRSNSTAVSDHHPVRKQEAAVSQITDGQVQATSISTATATIPSNSTYISSYEGAGIKMESKNMGFVVGLAALLFL
ncbi:Ans1p [Saccharomyces eubayanus]|uniref:Ans1p n=1 Tax=Saccharomyces eubayanus TaxID=1080349 RepID=UPI0006C02EC8|nr:ANS1-like protein [Saccharomyces eubayanus]KOG99188.1 ANS1-like protein [Saccharomyces eubayanus]